MSELTTIVPLSLATTTPPTPPGRVAGRRLRRRSQGVATGPTRVRRRSRRDPVVRRRRAATRPGRNAAPFSPFALRVSRRASGLTFGIDLPQRSDILGCAWGRARSSPPQGAVPSSDNARPPRRGKAMYWSRSWNGVGAVTPTLLSRRGDCRSRLRAATQSARDRPGRSRSS